MMKLFVAVTLACIVVASAVPTDVLSKPLDTDKPVRRVAGVAMMRRAGSSGTTPSASSSTTPTPSAPTAVPTMAPTTAVTAGAGGSTITQQVTVADIANAAAYTATVQTAYNRAFGVAAGVYNVTTG